MDEAALRAAIRAAIREEMERDSPEPSDVAPRGATETIVEEVELRNDSDLAAFVGRLLEVARTPEGRTALEKGAHRFRLAKAGQAASSPRGALVTERDVDALAPGVSEFTLPFNARLTPLAKDKLRERGVRIRREEA